ncbi:MAG TPA: hypothetical protein VLT86_01580 [Vicinamibacterales bacterium]|nr:hypothetical protein [Vicinamibacterales bacterium]
MAGLVVVAAAVVAAQAGKVVKSSDGACQATVPASWIAGSLPSTANSADKSLTIVVSSPKMIDSFDELKKTAQTVYKESKVTKDSATEFEMQGKSVTGTPDVYRAIPGAAGKYCIAEVTYQSGTADDVRKIALTLKATGK